VSKDIFNHALKQGFILLFIYFVILSINDIFHFTNLKLSDTDFYLDTIKEINKFDKNKQIVSPIYVIEITDADVIKYKFLNKYALPKSLIRNIIQKYEQSEAQLLFMDLNIAKPSNLASDTPTKEDYKLLETINALTKKIILPKSDSAPLYSKIINPNIIYMSINYETKGDFTVRNYSTETNGTLGVAYYINREFLQQEPIQFNGASPWVDEKFLNVIVYKDFYENNNSYYSGLSKISLSQFLNSKNIFTDAIFLLGRVDKDSLDTFHTPIGVLPGIYLNANAIMSIFYYGEIRSYHLLNLFISFVLGFLFSICFSYLQIKTSISSKKEEMIAFLGIFIFSMTFLIISYLLLESYSIWIDYQKVIFAFTLYEGAKIFSSFKQLIRKKR